MAPKNRGKQREQDVLSASQGVDLVKHTSEGAIEEAEARAADWLFETDDSHDVPIDQKRIRARIVLDIETMWTEPPYQSHEQVLDTVRSFLLKSLASHRYIQFGAIRVQAEVTD